MNDQQKMGLVGGEATQRYHWGNECGWQCPEHQALKAEQDRASRSSSGGGSLYNSSSGLSFKTILVLGAIVFVGYLAYHAFPGFRAKWDASWDSKDEIPQSVRNAKSYDDPIFK